MALGHHTQHQAHDQQPGTGHQHHHHVLPGRHHGRHHHTQHDPTAVDPFTQPLNRRPNRVFSWRWSNFHLLDLLRYQTWGALAVLLPAVGITAWSHWSLQKHPTIRPAFVYDATISYDIVEEETVASSLAVVGNWVAFVVAVLAVELGLMHHAHSLTTSLAAVVHWIYLGLTNFLVVTCITEVTKPYSGRLRPDFLHRCRPEGVTVTGFDLFQEVTCTAPDSDTVIDGRLSFPSGHASNSMSVAWFTALYLVWSLYHREGVTYARHLFLATNFLKRIGLEVAYALLYCFLLFVLLLSWFIGITRFWDSRHNIADILGGFMIGLIFTTPAFLAAVGQYKMFSAIMDARAAQRGELQHTAALGPAMVATNGSADTGAGCVDGGLPVTMPPGQVVAGQGRYQQQPHGTFSGGAPAVAPAGWAATEGAAGAASAPGGNVAGSSSMVRGAGHPVR